MPYIKLADRPMFDTMIDGLVPKMRSYRRIDKARVAASLVSNALTPLECFNFGSAINEIILALAKRIRVRGDANYCVCRILLESMTPEDGWDYHSLSDVIVALDAAITFIYDAQREQELEDAQVVDAISVLVDAATEIERRLLGPYEDQAILKNGDMACFDEDFAYRPLDLNMSKWRDDLNTSGEGSGRDACGCNPCRCEPEHKKVARMILDNWHRRNGMDPAPPVTEALTQEQCDAVDKERRSDG